MKNLLFLVSLFIVSTRIAAQPNASIKWSKEFKTYKEAAYSHTVGYIGDYYYTVGQKKSFNIYGLESDKSIFIKKYNIESLGLENEIEITPFEYDGAEAHFSKALCINNTISVLYHAYNKDNEIKYLILKQIDEKGVISKPLVVAQMRIEKKELGSFITTVSQDSSKILIFYNRDSETNKFFDRAVAVFDNNFTELWHKEIRIPYENLFFSIRNLLIANNGDVYILGFKQSLSRTLATSTGLFDKVDKTYRADKLYKLFKVSKAIDIEELDISNDKATNEGVKITYNNEDLTLKIAGTYEKDKNSTTVFYKVINATSFTTIEERTLELTPEKFGAKNFNAERRARALYNNLVFRNIIDLENGKTTIIAEKLTHKDKSGSFGSVYRVYYFSELLVFDISQNNKDITIEKLIHKSQTSGFKNPKNVSYKVFIENSDIHILYLNHRKNLDLKEGSPLRVLKIGKGVLVQEILKADGSSYKNILIDNKKEGKKYLNVSSSILVNGNKLLLSGYSGRGRNTIFGTITFE